VSGPNRLTGLRLLGFKSFAERTTVEFGPGISAIVWPNGSGKSNLADALRWTLGEAGRSLRTRRAEDVIFAGSSARRATSMADVTLLLDNRDRLLPVDYGEIELGRRLYRSGENEYLLNRQRIRLRDLIELLDAGNLADNAFLFIGQGMVDQALALRPEERRPLFEEAAGVRRHERRRRQAESELTEAEANLERLRDVLAELRPQARRLAAQAEQLVARRSAGHDLAEALVVGAQNRWQNLSAAAQRSQAELAAAHAEADAALSELRTAEEEAQQLSRALTERAARESAQRALLDDARGQTLELRLVAGRLRSELEAAKRERQRIETERDAIAARAAEAQRVLAREVPAVNESLVAEVERLDAEAARMSSAATGEPGARPDAVAVDVDALRRRSSALATQTQDASARLAASEEAVAAAAAAVKRAAHEVVSATDAHRVADETARSARTAFDAAVDGEAAARTEHAAAEATRASLSAQLDSTAAALKAMTDGSLGRAARARGGALAAEGLEVDAQFRQAVAAALAEAAQAWLVDEAAAVALPRQAGSLLLRGATRPAAGAAAMLELARVAGGGHLVDAIRRDPQVQVTRLLGRTLWVPTLEHALRIRAQLQPGWQVATLAGQLVSDHGLVRLAPTDRYIELSNERAALEARLTAAEPDADAGLARLNAAVADRTGAELALRTARAELDEARRALSLAEEVQRTSQRRHDGVLRDLGTARSRIAGLSADAADIDERLSQLPASPPQHGVDPAPRIAEITTRRAELTRRLAAQQDQSRAAADAMRRAEVAISIDESRSLDLDAQSGSLASREVDLAIESERIALELGLAERSETALVEELKQIVGGASDDRVRLLSAETSAARVRERVRAAETRSRSAEVASMEAVLQLDAQREQLLVELAGIGFEALAALTGEAVEPGPRAESDIALGDELASALDTAIARWQAAVASEPTRTSAAERARNAEPAALVAPPGPGKLAALRRRFHELGAGNPFAAAEYAEARSRLDSLEAQSRDLEAAIASTRQLIGDLNSLIATQFRNTFKALEGAFARRFAQLFDGGEAELALTAPDDLSTTGIEISARPPGKKRQPLQMLSGGERALTAVALLLAMLEVRPVPFCVLDEVDAALDEANIGRFAQALRGLADQTQFIVITHNRGTIESADALYGVTIGSDAVSRVVSLRLPPVSTNGASSPDTAPAIESTEVLA
jgi:chromosome segregation protein